MLHWRMVLLVVPVVCVAARTCMRRRRVDLSMPHGKHLQDWIDARTSEHIVRSTRTSRSCVSLQCVIDKHEWPPVGNGWQLLWCCSCGVCVDRQRWRVSLHGLSRVCARGRETLSVVAGYKTVGGETHKYACGFSSSTSTNYKF